jgi:hypothetical protein
VPRTLSFVRVLLATLVLCAAGAGAAYAADSGDVTAPVVTGVAVAPAAVDASTGPATVVVYAHLADPTTVAAATVRLAGAAAPLVLVSGDAYDGEWSGTATVPASTPRGPLTAYLDVADALGNGATTITDGAVSVLDAPPAAPATVSAAVGAAPGTLRVDWMPPPANGGSPVTAYAVRAEPVSDPATDAPSDTPSVAATTDADATGVTLSGLADATRYVVRVTAANAAGSGPSAVADTTSTATNTPSAPADMSVTPGDGALDVRWTPPASDGGSAITAYEVRATSATGPVPPVSVTWDATTATIPGLADGTAYDVTVAAVNALGSGIAATTRATPRSVPDAPGIGTVTAGDTTVVVRWTPPAHDGGAPITAYLVTAYPSGTVRVEPGTATSATVNELPNGVPVAFTVTAVNAAGAGLASAPSIDVTPRKPAHFSVLAQSSSTVTYGTASVVRAAVRTRSGRGIPGIAVDLLARVRPATTWRRVASATTGSTGVVTLRATLPATAALKLHNALGALALSEKALRPVYVATRVGATASTTRLVAGKTLVVHGSIASAHPVGSTVYLQRHTSAGWSNVARGTMLTSTTYRVRWRPHSTGAWYLRVVKPADNNHALGRSRSWRQYVVDTVVEVARAIRADSGITLDTVHASGVVDSATAAANLAQLAAGGNARRSSYGTAPGGSTPVLLRVLSSLRAMGVRGRVTVSEVAGGSHAAGSAHYSGRALDVRIVNGVHVARGSSYGWVVDTCRAYGATHVYHPSYDPYGGHAGHVHCDWS